MASFRRDAQGRLVALPERFLENISGKAAVRPDPVDFRDRLYEPRLTRVPRALPPRLPDGFPVRDQVEDGPCTGHALAGVIDILRWLADGQDRLPAPASGRMLYELARSYDGLEGEEEDGSTLRGAIRGFYHNGACLREDAFEDTADEWVLTLARVRQAREIALGGYYRLRHHVHDYQAALVEAGCILCSAMVHENWKLGAVRQNGRIALPPATDGTGVLEPTTYPVTGSHAFVIVGYDEEGFFVLNSRGPGWGRKGVARWSYADWQAHVLDAWVLGLSGTTGTTFNLVGAAAGGHTPATPRLQVDGHYLHLRRGSPVARGIYPSAGPLASSLRGCLDTEATGKGRQVMLWVESGLEGLEPMARRAARLAPAFLRLGIYPVFLWWHVGLATQVEALLDAVAGRLADQTGDLEAERAPLLEDFARTCLRPLWADLEDTARATAKVGWEHLEAVLGPSVGSAEKLHVVAHGAGALVLCHLARRLGNGGFPRVVASTTLLAPICTVGELLTAVPRLGRVALQVLPEGQELADRVGPYQGSWARLAGRALRGERDPAMRPGGAADTRSTLAGTMAGASLLKQKAPRKVQVHPVSGHTPGMAVGHLGLADDPATVARVAEHARAGVHA